MTKILMVAGEVSGDMHAARVVSVLKEKDSSLEIYGLGGPEMAAAGCHVIRDMMSLAVVGFVEVLKHYRTFKRVFDETIDWIGREKPSVVVLIDYPGFNLRLAQKIKRLYPEIRIVYYITPQVWAWHKSRVKILDQVVDRLLVIFPFEQDFFEQEGVMQSRYVGHPILDQEQFQDTVDRSYETRSHQIGLLPGSRVKEIQNLLPDMLRAIDVLGANYEVVIPAANLKCEQEIQSVLKKTSVRFSVRINRDAYSVMKESACVVVASGTATLECACFCVPMVIVYRVSWITWAIAKLVLNIPFVGIVNILANRKIVPELLQYQVKPSWIAKELTAILDDSKNYEKIVQDLKHVKQVLGGGASRKVAQEITQLLSPGQGV